MQNQKIINLLNDSSNQLSNFATNNWLIVDDQKNIYMKRKL